ncbi:MAG: glycine cleavage system aminomethyltransferase GcvT [Pseudomonadota bacterium]
MSKKTPLYTEHQTLGAKMADFAGWQMPIQYSGIINEHNAVRTSAGLFDVSHMGEIEFSGPSALETVNYLTTNDAAKLKPGQAQYSILLNEQGTVVDDIIVYCFDPERFIMVVNASNAQKDFNWVRQNNKFKALITDRGNDFALLAFQGPKAKEVLQTLTDVKLENLPPFHFAQNSIAGQANCVIARTGYTGEPGYEIFCAPEAAPAIWQAILEKGKPLGVLPVGLGARDTLRLEMKYSLYGHEITDQTNPLEAGLGWVVKLDKTNDFIGKQALRKIKEQGLSRKLIGFKMLERGIPREGCPIFIADQKVGVVTSGTMSPSLKEAIGIGYVPVDQAKLENKILIDIRGALREAVVVKTPFYSHQ